MKISTYSTLIAFVIVALTTLTAVNALPAPPSQVKLCIKVESSVYMGDIDEIPGTRHCAARTTQVREQLLDNGDINFQQQRIKRHQ
ncbi:13743_t:CDS:2 [Funneliformis geosporum]|uniref:13743_t:CDS:1 n=1 Tax=Funneliformis geosporum TaxID=1117311 RepID=A0A9W4WVY6_9GLOM|nr:13743_t:CDS:2 [Funneliformis geosporum]